MQSLLLTAALQQNIKNTHKISMKKHNISRTTDVNTQCKQLVSQSKSRNSCRLFNCPDKLSYHGYRDAMMLKPQLLINYL